MSARRPLTVAVQADALHQLNPDTDTTLMLMREALHRGHCVYAYQPPALSLNAESKSNRVSARAQRVRVENGSDFALEPIEVLEFLAVDVVLMRQEPPFDLAYTTFCHILEQAHPRPLVVNNPFWVRNLPEKLFPLEFPAFIPETLVSADEAEIRAFHRAHREIVLKPLNSFASRAVFHIGSDGANLGAALEALLPPPAVPLIVQRFLPEIRTLGERRAILIDGELAGIYGRYAGEGEIRVHVHAGGSRRPEASLTPRQHEICETIGPVLRERGLVLAGLDLIGDFLTEINITCPTGLPLLKQFYGDCPEITFWQAVERKLG